MRFNFYLFITVFCCLFNISIFSAEKEDVVNTIQNPFARGILKPPQYGSILDRENSSNRRMDDIRALDDFRYYRTLAIYENDRKSIGDVIQINASEKADNSYNAFYIILGKFTDKKSAQQASRDFISALRSNLNHRVTIKECKGILSTYSSSACNNNKKTSAEKVISYVVEYGPFSHSDLATATCYFLAGRTNQFILDCDLINKRLVYKDEITKELVASATVGLSQPGLIALRDSPLAFNQKDLIATSLAVYEGEMLGPPGFFIVDINQYGIYLASKFNENMLIPAVTFPVNNPIVAPIASPAGTAPPTPLPTPAKTGP